MGIKRSITIIIHLVVFLAIPAKAEYCVVDLDNITSGSWTRISLKNQEPIATWQFKPAKYSHSGDIDCSGNCGGNAGAPVGWSVVGIGLALEFETDSIGSNRDRLDCDISSNRIRISYHGETIFLFRRFVPGSDNIRTSDVDPIATESMRDTSDSPPQEYSCELAVAELKDASQIYTEKHPDMQRMRQEIEANCK